MDSANPSTDALRIRRGGADDAEPLIAFNRAMARETEARELDLPTITAGVRALLAAPDAGFYLLAEAPEEIAGSLMVTTEWSDWRNGYFWWIQSVYVRPEYRRRGVYRSLYDHVRRLARERDDVCGFRLYVEDRNEAARRTYEALGMRETTYRLYEEPC